MILIFLCGNQEKSGTIIFEVSKYLELEFGIVN